MKINPTSMGAAPLVASALGRSLGVEVVVNDSVSTAKTDGKTIYLPSLPVDLEDDISKILWGFIHHEAGHCRHTDFDTLTEPELRTDALLKYLFGALEDIRMERAHMSIYPGSVRILSDLVFALVKIGFFKPVSDDADIPQAFHAFVLFHLRSTVLGQSALSDFSDGARNILTNVFGSGFVIRLVSELQAILVSENTNETLNLAFRIREFLNEELEKLKPPESSNDVDDGEDQEEDAPSNDDLFSPNADSDDANESSEVTTDSTESEDSEDNDSDVAEASDDDDGSLSGTLAEIIAGADLDPSLGDLGDALKDVLNQNISNDQAHTISMPTDDRRAVGYRDSNAVSNARIISTRLAVQLKRQLESMNEVKSDPSTRGKRLSRRHLTRVAFKDYRVFANREYLPEVNTAVVSLIDMSSSMTGPKADIASKATLATSIALGTIPLLAHAVGAFPSMNGDDQVELVQDFHEKAEAVSSRFSLSPRGYTPLAEALLWAASRLLNRSEERRIIFVSTDGQPDDVTATRQILAHLRKLGIEVHVLGIDSEDSYQLFESFAVVKDVNRLADAFLTLFQRVLRRTA